MKIRFQDVLLRITGISTPIFGVSWDPPQVDREIVKDVMAHLEDKRALYYPYHREILPAVEASIREIRHKLSDALGKVEKDSVAGEAFTWMRRACREFSDEVEGNKQGHSGYPNPDASYIALGKLRGLFGIQIARLSVAYGIDVEEELARILPPRPDDEQIETKGKLPHPITRSSKRKKNE